MKKEGLLYLLGLSSILVLSGCVVRTYPVVRDRVDQNISEGNRGYLMGKAPATAPVKERKTSRRTQVVEIELSSPIKFEKMKGPKEGVKKETAPIETTEEVTTEGNRGYMTQTIPLETMEPVKEKFEKYTVQKNDTLQKISRKFYGTTRKWKKIYDANQGVLKGPDKLYVGQKLSIPLGAKTQEILKEPKDNLK